MRSVQKLLMSVCCVFFLLNQKSFAGGFHAHGYIALEGENGTFFFPEEREPRFVKQRHKTVSGQRAKIGGSKQQLRQLPGGYLGYFHFNPTPEDFYVRFKDLTGYDLRGNVYNVRYHEFDGDYFILHVKLLISDKKFMKSINQLGKRIGRAIKRTSIDRTLLEEIGVQDDKLVLVDPDLTFMWSPKDALAHLNEFSTKHESDCFELFLGEQAEYQIKREEEARQEARCRYEREKEEREQADFLRRMAKNYLKAKARQQEQL